MEKENKTLVYLVVHELFGILFKREEPSIGLVTPVLNEDEKSGEHPHKYKIARFKDGAWQGEASMIMDALYGLEGVVPRTATATALPCHSEFSPHPAGKFQLNPDKKPYCRWQLSLPKQIHQLRLVSIPDASRPIFTGDPHGDALEAQLTAVSLVHVFEYEKRPDEKVKITVRGGKTPDLDYQPDKVTNTINLHLWAQMEDESGMDDDMANEHARNATKALVDLFQGMKIEGHTSLAIDNGYTVQVLTPLGIRFPELMTLAEKFSLLGGKHEDVIECTGKTCGHGGNLYVEV